MKKHNAKLTPFVYANINTQGDWLVGGNDWMRWRTCAVITNDRTAANDETTYTWGIAA